MLFMCVRLSNTMFALSNKYSGSEHDVRVLIWPDALRGDFFETKLCPSTLYTRDPSTHTVPSAPYHTQDIPRAPTMPSSPATILSSLLLLFLLPSLFPLQYSLSFRSSTSSPIGQPSGPPKTSTAPPTPSTRPSKPLPPPNQRLGRRHWRRCLFPRVHHRRLQHEEPRRHLPGRGDDDGVHGAHEFERPRQQNLCPEGRICATLHESHKAWASVEDDVKKGAIGPANTRIYCFSIPLYFFLLPAYHPNPKPTASPNPPSSNPFLPPPPPLPATTAPSATTHPLLFSTALLHSLTYLLLTLAFIPLSNFLSSFHCAFNSPKSFHTPTANPAA